MKYCHESDTEYTRLVRLVRRLCAYSGEGTYFEFKENNAAPEMIGEYVSCLSNMAAIENKNHGYLIWGIEDKSHAIVGTSFCPDKEKVGNEDLELWLSHLCEPKITIEFFQLAIEGKNVVIMKVGKAMLRPTRFRGVEIIRIGSNRKKLSDFPHIEAKLWDSFKATGFELGDAKTDLDGQDVIRLLDVSEYFRLIGSPEPRVEADRLLALLNKKMIREQDDGLYSITNAGAILLARDLNDFPDVSRKALRVIEYESSRKSSSLSDRLFSKGYMLCFEDALAYINGLVGRKENYASGLREEKSKFPPRAIREALGNIIAHQDLSISGAGPIVEVHPAFIDFTSPGKFNGDTRRIIDMIPVSNNEVMADVLRLAHICEERGSGFDVMEEAMADRQLPSPLVETRGEGTLISLMYKEKLSQWSDAEIVQTIYLCACYNAVNHVETTNASIRERLGVKEQNAALVSRYLRAALDKGMIRISDINAGAKARKYVPYWA